METYKKFPSHFEHFTYNDTVTSRSVKARKSPAARSGFSRLPLPSGRDMTRSLAMRASPSTLDVGPPTVYRRHWLWPRVILAHLPVPPPENITKFRSFVLLLEGMLFLQVLVDAL
jgi:hypothetical protein